MSPSLRVTREGGRAGSGSLKFDRMMRSDNDDGKAGSAGWLILKIRGPLILSLTRDEGRAGKEISFRQRLT